MKRQAPDGEETFIFHIFEKELVFRMYKEFLNPIHFLKNGQDVRTEPHKRSYVHDKEST